MLLLVIICSTLTAWGITAGIFSLFRQRGIVDKPHLYPHEQGRAPLPYPGGAVLVVNLLLWSPWILSHIAPGDVKKALYVLIASLCTTLIMAWDDRRRTLSPLLRLSYQIGLGTFFGLTAIKIGYVSNMFGGIITLDTFQSFQWTLGTKTVYFVPLIATIVWYVIVINAINWSDNGRAMTSSLSLSTLLVLALLSLKLYTTDVTLATQSNSLFVLCFLTILIPTVAVFWFYDIKRRCIIGDAGTMFLGFIIGTLAIVSGGKVATASIVLGMYFIDAFYVVIRRLLDGKNPMKGDFTHLHHRLSAKGVESHIQRTLVMVLSFLFGLGAIFLDTWGKVILFCLIIAVVICIADIARIVQDILKKRPRNRAKEKP